MNANGQQDAGDPGQGERTVFLDGNGNGIRDSGEPSMLTASDGSGSVTGTGTVRQVLYAGDFDNSTGSSNWPASSRPEDLATRINSSVTIIPPFNGLFRGGVNANDAYVRSLYRGVLGRHGQDFELVNSWLRYMMAGGTPKNVAEGFWHSPEHLRNEVAGYYRHYLGRLLSPVDPEVQNWVNIMKGWKNGVVTPGLDEEQVVMGFLTSPEYRRLHSQDSDFVQALYSQLLGREGSMAEVDAWVRVMSPSNGPNALSRTQVVRDFLLSPESAGRAVNGFYVGLLNRLGEQTGIDGWIGLITSGAISYGDTGTRFLDSGEFASRAAQ